MRIIRIALDWTPNTIHAGLFLAQHKGFYKDAGIKAEFISPEADNYKLTPARRLSRRTVDFAIAPSESVISYNTSRRPVAITSVASILQRDTSAIVTLKSSGITRPKQLDGRTYATYSARFEDGIVAQMVKNDGGKGEFKPVAIGRLGIWDMLKSGEADSTWVFMPWEGIEAKKNGLELNVFRMEDYGIPYGYTPLLLAHISAIRSNEDAYRRFMAATARAYEEIAANPESAASLLCEKIDHPNFSDESFIAASLRELQPALLNSNGKWGVMDGRVWGDFVNWLIEIELLRPKRPIEGWHLYTNKLLE